MCEIHSLGLFVNGDTCINYRIESTSHSKTTTQPIIRQMYALDLDELDEVSCKYLKKFKLKEYRNSIGND